MCQAERRKVLLCQSLLLPSRHSIHLCMTILTMLSPLASWNMMIGEVGLRKPFHDNPVNPFDRPSLLLGYTYHHPLLSHLTGPPDRYPKISLVRTYFLDRSIEVHPPTRGYSMKQRHMGVEVISMFGKVLCSKTSQEVGSALVQP